jgi:O-antigen/teichoic acid export membrane protein
LYEDDREAAPAVYARVMTYVLAGFGWIAVGLIAFGPELLAILTGPAYRGASSSIVPLAIAMVAMASTQITAGGISLMKRTKYLAMYAWLAAGINVLLNVVLDGPFGMIGAAWATAAAYLFLTLGYLLTSQRLWPIPFEVRRTLAFVALIAIFALAGMALPSGFTILAIAAKVGFCLAFVAAAFLSGAFDAREILIARIVLARIRR